ncbi:MAG: metabolite traffic protein EboE [Planctomycetota bacterium]
MFLKRPDGSETALCYSMNVHPGEGMDDVLDALREHVLPLRDRLGVTGRFAVGLRLAARAAAEGAEALRAFLLDHDLVAVTVNAFPYGNFHGERVKEAVYAPDWTTDERVAYTLNVARVLTELNEPGADVSLSTVPVSFKPWNADPRAAARRLMLVAGELAEMEAASGVRVRIAIEPEPFCTLETTAEMEAFWKQQLEPTPHLGVCPDTCHHAVRWESGADALDRYRLAGIPIPKIQLSSALEADSLADLQPFAEPRYLHQVVAQGGGDRLDLGLDGPALQGTLRCHFHVPVHKSRVGTARTTRDEMDAALDRAWETGATNCFEIETYTWDVLPLREGELLDSLEAEFRYVLGKLAR